MFTRRVGTAGLVAAVATAWLVAGAPAPIASAQTATRTFPAVKCTAKVGTSQLTQSQDVTVSIVAPDQVTAGQPFTITFPGGTNVLPNKSNGLTITSYRDLTLSYQMHGTTFTSGSIQNPGSATINGNPTPNTATINPSDTLVLGQPGPFPPGTLVTPDVSVGATAGAAGSSVTLNALTLTTTARINDSIDAFVTCNVPQDTLITIPVVGSVTPPTVDAGPDVSGNVGDAIHLAGTVTSGSGTATDAWTIDNASCSFAVASSPSTSVTCAQPGNFVATLTASDGVNSPVVDTARVTVTQVQPLVVFAGGPVSGTVSHAIALHGSVNDPGRTPVISWTINSSTCTFSAPAAASTTVLCTGLGTFTATLHANDGVNPAATDTASVTVHPDLPPTVSAGPDLTGDTGAAIRLAGAVSDPESDPVSVIWTANDPKCAIADPAQLVTTITCSPEGNYTATLTATDHFTPAVSDTTAVAVSDIRFPFNWVVDATTHLKKLNQDVTVPTGTFVGSVDLTTGQLGGDITLPPAQVTLNLAGIGLVTANMQIVEAQPITGTLDVSSFGVTATAVFNIFIPSAYPTATPTVNVVGNSCQTSTPVSVTMRGTADLTGASTFSGVYTIPPLKTCGLATTALNLVVPGPDNTFSATVQPPPAPPSVSTQPVDQTVVNGQSYSFAAAAVGYPAPTVQWQVAAAGSGTFTNISGATGGSLSGTAVLADSGKRFRAVFSNASGTATTDAATLTVAVAPDAPTIGTAVARARSVDVVFTPPAHNGGSTVLDYTASCSSGDGGVAGSATGASSPVTVTGLTPGAAYSCTVTARNIAGSSAPSGPSNLVRPTAPPAVTTQPSDATVTAGQPYTFTAAASGAPAPTVQWQVSTDGGATFADLAGATGDSVGGTAAFGDSGKRFRAVYTNATGSATSTAATLTVLGIAPQVTTQPANQSVVVGHAYTFSVAASGTPAPTVQWQVSTDDGGTFTNVAGATSNSLTGTAALSDTGKQFRAVYTNSTGSATTNPATLTVSGIAPTVTTQPVVNSVDAGQSYTFTAAASGTPTPTVQWQVSTDGGGTFTNVAGATSNSLTGTAALSENGKKLRAVYTNSAGTATTNAAVLNVAPAIPISIGDAAISEGDSGKTRGVVLAVTLAKPSTQNVTVKYATVNGSAVAPADFAVKSGTLTFKPGVTTLYVTVAVKPDTTVEADESLQVALSAPTGGAALSASRSVGTATILNDDVGGGLTASVGDASICEGNTGAKRGAHIVVSLSAPAPSIMTVKLALSAGTATSGTDYQPWATKTVTFKAGQMLTVVTVPVVPDTVHEGDETALLTLSSPTTGLSIRRGSGTLTILDDD